MWRRVAWESPWRHHHVASTAGRRGFASATGGDDKRWKPQRVQGFKDWWGAETTERRAVVNAFRQVAGRYGCCEVPLLEPDLCCHRSALRGADGSGPRSKRW